MQAFMESRKKPSSHVDQILSVSAVEQVKKNRIFSESVLRCLELYGRQGIALRGHRDDGVLDDNINMGNFKALLHLLSRTDENLREHLQATTRNATYTSKTTQNGLLQCVMDFIQSNIVKQVKAQASGAYCGAIADEVTGVSNWEQLGLVILYFGSNDEAVERLL